MKILYFDDEPFISRALAEHLRLVYKREVTLVSEINELFDELKDNQYDIIILDIMTPVPDSHIFTKREIKEMEGGMSTGIVLAKKIWKQNGSIPILFLTARSQPDAITHFKDEGRKCDWLRKPELAKTINEKLLELLNS